MESPTNLFSGYRTYIVAVLIILAAIMKKFDILDVNTMNSIITMLLGGGMVTLRMGYKSDAEKALKNFTKTNTNQKGDQ